MTYRSYVLIVFIMATTGPPKVIETKITTKKKTFELRSDRQQNPNGYAEMK